MLVTSRHQSEDGRNGMDNPKNIISEAQRRSGERVRQAKVWDESRGTRGRAGTFVNYIRTNHVPQHSANAQPSTSRTATGKSGPNEFLPYRYIKRNSRSSQSHAIGNNPSIRLRRSIREERNSALRLFPVSARSFYFSLAGCVL